MVLLDEKFNNVSTWKMTLPCSLPLSLPPSWILTSIPSLTLFSPISLIFSLTLSHPLSHSLSPSLTFSLILSLSLSLSFPQPLPPSLLPSFLPSCLVPATLLNQSGGALSKLITREGVALLQGDSQWLFLSKFEVGIVSFG